MITLGYFQYVLNPTYSQDQIEQLDKNEKMVRAYDSTLYLPGKKSHLAHFAHHSIHFQVLSV